MLSPGSFQLFSTSRWERANLTVDDSTTHDHSSCLLWCSFCSDGGKQDSISRRDGILRPSQIKASCLCHMFTTFLTFIIRICDCYFAIHETSKPVLPDNSVICLQIPPRYTVLLDKLIIAALTANQKISRLLRSL
jgi:hypothetical protein